MLRQKQRTMLTKQILLLSSNHDGEVLAAVAAANRTLAKANADWHDVIEAFDKGSNGEHYDGAGLSDVIGVVGRLGHPNRRRKHGTTARFEHTVNLLEQTIRVVHVLNHLGTNHAIARCRFDILHQSDDPGRQRLLFEDGACVFSSIGIGVESYGLAIVSDRS